MYLVKFLPNENGDTVYSVTNETHTVTDVYANHVRIVRNSVYCDVGDGYLHIVPLDSLISVAHMDDTPECCEEDCGGMLYIQYCKKDKSPTGLASYNHDCLAKWLMDGYDVVIETVDKSGFLNRHYITNLLV